MSESTLVKLLADWPAPSNIVAFTSCRTGGVSLPPFASLNMGRHVGDDVNAVVINRQRLIGSCEGLQGVQWLNQIHSNKVVLAAVNNTFEAGDADKTPAADACYTQQNAVACAVMTADCLPLLICDDRGEQVAAVHAGWRGLLNGVIENTLKTFLPETNRLLVWLGPAISQQHFEVGDEVRQAFLAASPLAIVAQVELAFRPNPGRVNHYFADLYQLARIRLTCAGVNKIYGGDYCCFEDENRFFSYRREPITGRMVSLIYRCA